MRFILAGIMFIAAAALGWWAYQSYGPNARGVAFGAPFQLVDDKGQPITEQAFRGQPSAVFFGFTHCPEVCPTTLAEMDDWLKTLGNDGKHIRAYFVTVDPARDTPEVMNSYVSNVSNRIVGITGEPAKVEQMVRDFKVYFKKVPTTGSDYTMDHTASVMLLKSNGDFFGTIAYEESKDAAVAKLKRLATEG